jgi:hypothetical protein
MKTWIGILFLALFTYTLQAQITEDRRTMALGEQPALILQVQNADEKWLEKEWRSYMGTYGRVRKVKRASEYWVEGAQIMDIGGADPINVYGRTEKAVDGAMLLMWVDIGGRFLNSIDHPQRWQAAKDMLKDFHHQMKVELVEIELEEQQDQLSDLERDLKKLERANEGYHRDIEKAEEAIKKARENIMKNQVEQETARQQIAAQAALVNAVKQKLEETQRELPEE